MDTRDRLAAEFGLKVEQVDEWLQRAAIDIKQLSRLPYEEDLWIRYE